MSKRVAVFLTAILLASPVLAEQGERRFKGWSGPKPEVPPCACRSPQGKVMLGGTICQNRKGRMVTLRCELVLNNTAWKEVGDGCQISALPHSEPFLPLDDST